MIIVLATGLMFAAFQASGSCSAFPETVIPPENSVRIICTCDAGSSWTPTDGKISGSGFSVVLDTSGLSPRSVTVASACAGVANQKVVVVVGSPPLAPQPQQMALCTISFARDKRRPTRVDNEAKACLDDVVLELQRSADASLVVIGTVDAAEKGATRLAAQRAVNTKDYLAAEKGIDATRIKVSTSESGEPKQVQMFLIPAGAVSPENLHPVDESKIKPIARYRRDY